MATQIHHVHAHQHSLLYSQSHESGTTADNDLKKQDSAIDLRDTHQDVEKFCTTAFALPIRLTHTRFNPVFHRWIFPHFVTGIPVISSDISADLVSLGDLPWTKRNWFRIEADDHLEHSHKPTTLRAKLDRCLVSHGVKPETFPYCYLVTPPRFLAFGLFNAVTLWFLYTEDQSLGALLVEVHNSSQERRNYLLHGRLRGGGCDGGDCPATAVRKDLGEYIEFTCEKMFHANGFTPRNGRYSTRVIDPLRAKKGANGAVDATITLKGETGQTTLVARLCSNGAAFDLTHLSMLRKVFLLWRCSYTMIVMWPTVAYQMCILHVARKLKLYQTPVPLPGSVSRPSTESEALVESMFRQYLVSNAERFLLAVDLEYEAPTTTSRNPERVARTSSSARRGPESVQTVQLQVLTPAFYSNLVRYPSLDAAIKGEIVPPDYSSGTIRVENPDLLVKLLTESRLTFCHNWTKFGWRTFLLERIARLREQVLPNQALTPLDEYILSESTRKEFKEYSQMIFVSLLNEKSKIGLVCLKLYSLLVSMLVGVMLWSLPSVYGSCDVASLVGYYLLIASTVLWFLVVSKEDLAALLIV